METKQLLFVAAFAALALTATACSAASHPAAAMTPVNQTVYDPDGNPCQHLQANGYCPGYGPPAATPSSTPAPTTAAPAALTCAQAEPQLAVIFKDLGAQASTASAIGSMWIPVTNDAILGGGWNDTIPGTYGPALSSFENWESGLTADTTSGLGADVSALASDGQTMQQDWASAAGDEQVASDYTTFESAAATVASDCGITLTTPASEGYS